MFHGHAIFSASHEPAGIAIVIGICLVVAILIALSGL
jgi:hypothetical protein